MHRLGVGVDRVIEDTLRPLGLRARELRVLGFLGDRGRSQRELVALSGLDRTTMVAVVDRLEAAGLAVRLRDDSDRRRQRVAVTEAGAARLAEAAAALERAEAEFLSPLSASRQRALNESLRALFAVRRAVST